MEKKKHKILIIKLGYSETLVPQITRTCSLGDVLRTTVLLHLFKDDHVTWLTDQAALPLLENNPYIDRILTFDLLSVLRLESERFDKVINLEKVPGICALVDKIIAWGHYGFRFDQEKGVAEAYDRALEALNIACREDIKGLNDKPWAEMLYKMLGAKWKGQSYILGYKPKSKVKYDIGFNMHVGKLMPVKVWPSEYWPQLEKVIDGKYTVTYQHHLDDLTGYMDWINSCKMIVTSDSLAIYLGIALGKKVLGLFGPTPTTEQSPHKNLRMLRPDSERDCIPCFKTQCELDDSCMKYIKPETVFKAIDEWFKE